MRSQRVLALAALAAVFVIGCLQVGTGTGTNAAGAAADAGEGQDSGTQGTGCTEDPQTLVTLCAAIDTCPNVAVDLGAFPGCGFRLHGGAPIDLECLCSGALCPIGVPTTCEQASQLLAGQSALAVCQQVAQARCVALDTPDAGGVPPGCDRACQAACGAAADCVQICGC